MALRLAFNGKDNIEKLLNDSKQYGRHINGLTIESGIQYQNNSQTHFDLSFILARTDRYVVATIRCYAVANDRSNSQEVIDWGNGTLSDFQNLSFLNYQPKKDEPVINLSDGSVIGWSESDSVQKVEVVNQLRTTPSKWYDKSNIIGAIGIIIAIVLAMIGWSYFRNPA